MIRILFITAFLLISLDARENPFFPTNGEIDLPYTSNKKTNLPKLKQVSLTLPSTARIIKQVIVKYENMDASIESKSIDLENTIDWHLPLFVSQSYLNANTTKDSKTLKSKTNNLEYKQVGKIKYVEFKVLKNGLKIITKDKLLRNFLLAKPHRVVMDFKSESRMKNYFKDIKNSVFAKIRVGNHNDYYRIVIELDGKYRYKLKNLSNGCLITLE